MTEISHMARETAQDEEEDTMEDKYLCFPLNQVIYGIAIRYVTEVIQFQEITQVPHMPSYIQGVINLRGKVIPTLDVRRRFMLPERPYDDRTCIIVVDIHQEDQEQGIPVGLIVDTVEGVVLIPKDQVEPPPSMKKSAESRFIAGMGKVKKKIHILIDVHTLLFEEELEQLADG